MEGLCERFGDLCGASFGLVFGVYRSVAVVSSLSF